MGGGKTRYNIVRDTFYDHLAGEAEFLPECRKIVDISEVLVQAGPRATWLRHRRPPVANQLRISPCSRLIEMWLR